MDLSKFKITNSSKIKLTDKKILLELYYTSEPLFYDTEVIALFTKSKDKRSYSTLTVILEPRANEITTYESIKNGMLSALENGNFKEIGENKSLFYATLEPVATFINRSV